MTQKELVESLAEKFRLTEDEKEERYEKSGEGIFYNRVSFAKKNLKERGLIDFGSGQPARITEFGRKAKGQNETPSGRSDESTPARSERLFLEQRVDRIEAELKELRKHVVALWQTLAELKE